jgi:hypothetical protein
VSKGGKMKRFLFLSLMLFVGISTIPGYPDAEKTLAVLKLSSKYVSSDETLIITNLLQEELFNTGRYRLILKTEVENALKMLKIPEEKVLDVEEAVKIGNEIHAAEVVIGSINKLGNSYVIQVKLIDVTNGTVEKIESRTIKGVVDDIPGHLPSLAAALSGTPGKSSYPEHREQARITKDQAVDQSREKDKPAKTVEIKTGEYAGKIDAETGEKPITPKPPADDHIPGFDDSPPPPPKNSPQKSGTIPGFDNTPVVNKTYVSLVPALNQSPQKVDPIQSFSSIINRAIMEAFKDLITRLSLSWAINRQGHTIHDKKDEIKRLYAICSSSENHQDKMAEINTQILEPGKIDLVLTGTFNCDKKSGRYTVYPIIVSKLDNKLVMSKEFTYELNKKTSKIEKDFKAEIVDIIKKEFPSVLSPQPVNPSSPGNSNTSTAGANKDLTPSVVEFYVSFIPFTDVSSQPGQDEKSLADLLDEVMAMEMNQANRKNDKLVVNDANYTIHHKEAAVQELDAILSNPKLKDTQKVEKIINNLMTPNGIDFVVTVQCKEDTRNKVIIVRPFVISKSQRKIDSTNFIFPKDRLLCVDADTKQKILCQTAADNFGNAVKKLLEKL